MEKWLNVAAFILIIILFYTGLIHIFNRIRINKEMNKKHLSATSSRNGQFQMEVDGLDGCFIHKKIKGFYKGELPKNNDFIYLIKNDEFIVVKVLKAKQLQYDYDSNRFAGEVVVWGAKKSFTNCVATNVRPKKTIEVKKEISTAKASYPIVIKATYRNYMSAIITIFMGIVLMMMTIQSYMLLGFNWQIILFVILGVVFFVVGVILLIEATSYSLTMESDGVITIVKAGKKKQYKKEDYFYKAMVQRNNTGESYLLTIYTSANGEVLANVDDREEQFYNLYAALKQYKPKK